MSELLRFPGARRPQRNVYFNRRELNQLLSLYSRRVVRGEWRDYAIDHRPGMAVFSVFRHSQDRPLYAIAKCVGADAAPDYLILAGRRRLASGGSLDTLLLLFDEGLRIVS